MNFEDSKENNENNKNDPFSQSFGYGQNSYEQQNYNSQPYRQDLTEQSNFGEQYSYEQTPYNQIKSNDQPVYRQQAEFQQHQQSAYVGQGNSQQYAEAVYGQKTYGQPNNTQQYAGTYGQRTYGQSTYSQQNSPEQFAPNQNSSIYSKYYNVANGYNSAPQRTYPDGDRLTRFKDYYDLFASNQTKRWLNVLVIICYLSSLGMFILGFFSAANFLDCAVYAILTTLLLATKKWGFSLALTIYNGVAMLINIIFTIMIISMGISDFSFSTIRGLIRGLFVLILAIGVTTNLIKLNKGFKEHQATFRGY